MGGTCLTCNNFDGYRHYCTLKIGHCLNYDKWQPKPNPMDNNIVAELRDKVARLESDKATDEDFYNILFDCIWESLGKPEPFARGYVPGHIDELKAENAKLKKNIDTLERRVFYLKSNDTNFLRIENEILKESRRWILISEQRPPEDESRYTARKIRGETYWAWLPEEPQEAEE